MECEEFFVCLSTRHLEIFCHNQGFVMTCHWDQEQSCFTFTVVIVKRKGMVPTGGVNVVTGVVAGDRLTLAMRYLLIDGLTFRRCLKKE